MCVDIYNCWCLGGIDFFRFCSVLVENLWRIQLSITVVLIIVLLVVVMLDGD